MLSDSFSEAEQRIQIALQTHAISLDLSFLGLKALPLSIGQLANLTELYLSENQLTSLPNKLGQLAQQKDPEQLWGDLTRTTTPEGDVLWLCKEHIKEIYPTSS